jgi:hypothetical protein
MNESGSTPGESLAIVLNGVSGSGKSEVGQAVAKRLGLKFLDADDFHSVANKDKMHRGIALLRLAVVVIAILWVRRRGFPVEPQSSLSFLILLSEPRFA